MSHIVFFFKKNIVMSIALLAAIVTVIIVPPGRAYLDYFDWKNLNLSVLRTCGCLCTEKYRLFLYSGPQDRPVVPGRPHGHSGACVHHLYRLHADRQRHGPADLPSFGLFRADLHQKTKYMAFTFIMQNIAANLGGMLTPFGNPQNLYLYTKFEIPTLEFMGIMAPPFLLSVALITLCCFIFVKPEVLKVHDDPVHLPPARTALYLVLFLLSIVIVFRAIPYWIGLIVIPVVLIFADRHALKMVDYPLLLTFVFFFIFSGNMARIDVIRDFFSILLDKSTLLFSVLSCQFISNVPSAILLSQFTDNYPQLLVGVNIGGTGTLIASLASLITFREYTHNNPSKTGYYVKMFSAFNFGFLAILTGFMLILYAL